MNIKITYNWLCEYLETDASPYDLQKYLSLSGPSIERVDKIDEDYVFDIEITTNRIDMASVFGVAQEAQAIMPQYGFKAKLKYDPFKKWNYTTLNVEPVKSKQLDVTIENPDLCPRFTAMIFTDVDINKAPDYITKRLQMIDIKSINNVIDISNYLMVSLGQPTHMFDYDQIAGHKMIVRESKKGEKLTTLDDKELILPGGDIVIEDGSGKLIDLCGIMGGLNSSITKDTKNILFFVQTYNKRKIRKTSMLTAQRTMAATYFEKGLDPERVETTFAYGVELIHECTKGIAASELIDIYPHHRKEKIVHTFLTDIQKIMGVPIEEEKVITILEDLGFKVKRTEEEELAYPDSVKFTITVPTYRTDDVEIKEDIAEEVARVYGYHNLPNNIAPMVYIKQPKDIELLFSLQNKLKLFFKHIGLHEMLNYSMISEKLILDLGLKLEDHLKLANTISKEIEYLRLSLLPSLIKNMADNEGRKDTLKIFEIAKVYPKKTGELPQETYMLAIAVDTGFEDLKGIIQTMFRHLNITSYAFSKSTNQLFAPHMQSNIVNPENNSVVGSMGKLRTSHGETLGLKKDIYLAEITFSYITEHFKVIQPYVKPAQYSIIKLDANITPGKKSFEEIKKIAMNNSKILNKVDYVDSYKDSITLRFYFSSPDKNITDAQAKEELESILKKIA